MENRSTRLAVKLDRLDFEVDRVDDFSIDSTWPRFDRLDRSTRSTTGVYNSATKVAPLFDYKNDISKNHPSSHFKLFVPAYN